MKNIRKALALLLALCMILALAACGSKSSGEDSKDSDSGNTTSGSDSQTEQGNEPSNDNVSTEAASITIATYPVGKWGEEAVLNELKADFNAVYPNIEVNFMYLDYTNGDEQLTAAVEAGNAPDIIFEGPERLVANWGAKGFLVDLSDLVVSGMYADTIATCTSADGNMYMFPIVQTSHCMGINYDAFEKAGALQYIDEETHTWTTEGFQNAVAALVADGWSTVGAVYCNGQGGDQGTRALVTNLYGGTYANPEHTQYTFNCAENVKALEMLRDLEGINFDASIVGGDEITLFCNGTLAMAFCWNAVAATGETQGMTAQFNIFPMAFPTESGDPVLQGGIYGFGVFDNGDQGRIDAAKTFIKFMTEDEAEYSKAVKYANFWPTRDVPGIYDGNEVMTEYGMFAPYMGDYYQITLGWTEARTQWWTALQAIGSGADVQETLDTYAGIANAAADAEAAG